MSNNGIVGFLFAGASCLIGLVAVSSVLGSSKKSFYQSCLNDARRCYENDSDKLEKEYEDTCNKIFALEEREKKEIDKRINEWETASGFKASINALNDEYKTRVTDIKKNTFNYDQEIQTIKKHAQEAIEDWKTRENYDYRMREFELGRETAKSDYAYQKASLNLTNRNGSNDELLRLASDAKKRKLDDINSKKQRLETELKTTKNQAEVQMKRDIQSLTDRMNRAIDDVGKDINTRKNILRTSRTSEMSSIIEDVRKERTDEENGYEGHLNSLMDSIDEVYDKIEARFHDLAKSKDSEDKVVRMIRDDYGWSSNKTIALGIIPVVGVEIGVAIYLLRLFDIANKIDQ